MMERGLHDAEARHFGPYLRVRKHHFSVPKWYPIQFVLVNMNKLNY